MPKFSIIIPFYNRQQWLLEAIDSVFAQTISDFEIILINDGSTEKLISLPIDARIHYIDEIHRGPAAARNLGLELAQGDYIAFLDSDDLFFPQKLGIQLDKMEKNPHCGFSHTSYQRIGSDGTLLDVVHSGSFYGRVYPDLFKNCPIATPTVVLRRSILSEDTRFDENLFIAEDVIFWAELARKTELLGIDIPLSKVRMHGNNSSVKVEKQIIGQINMLAFIKKSTDLPFFKKRQLMAYKSANLSFYFAFQGERAGAVKWIMRGLLQWPFDPRAYKNILHFIWNCFSNHWN